VSSNLNRLTCLLTVMLLIGAGRPALAADDVVLRWNAAMLQAIRNTGFAPTRAARGLAIVHTCMYDAWAAYDAVAVGTRLGAQLRRPSGERTVDNKSRAVSFAAYRALMDLFPSQKAGLFDPLMNDLGYDGSDTSTDTSTATGIGNVTCAAVLAFRHGDGSNQVGDINGGAPYSDYTGYAPVNTAGTLNYPDRWQPLPGQVFLAPHWGLVTPFALTSPDQFRPKAPATLGSNEFEHQAREIANLSARLDDRRKAIALYWADGPNTETPPGHWNLFAQFVSRRDGYTTDQNVKLFFVLGNALLDASIAVWECKRLFDAARPVTAIRYLYAGRTIDAWAGPGLGTQSIAGEAFRSYIATPPFAEYTSGHSAFSAAAAKVLTLVTGRAAFNASVTILAGSFTVPEPAPAADVTLSWATFEDAANEAGLSRRYGGIHFKDGDLASRKMGRQIGDVVWTNARSYFNGTAATP
jgi:hypothetical protein